MSAITYFLPDETWLQVLLYLTPDPSHKSVCKKWRHLAVEVCKKTVCDVFIIPVRRDYVSKIEFPLNFFTTHKVKVLGENKLPAIHDLSKYESHIHYAIKLNITCLSGQIKTDVQAKAAWENAQFKRNRGLQHLIDDVLKKFQDLENWPKC